MTLSLLNVELPGNFQVVDCSRQLMPEIYLESPAAWRLARYSAKDSALWIACCLPLGSLGSYSVGSGSRVASPPPKPLPPIWTLDMVSLDGVRPGAMKADATARNMASIRKRNMTA